MDPYSATSPGTSSSSDRPFGPISLDDLDAAEQYIASETRPGPVDYYAVLNLDKNVSRSHLYV
jgi:hypothetical protein